MPTHQAYLARRAAGLCPSCGGGREDAFTLCRGCRRHLREQKRQRTARGICIACPSKLDRPGTRCTACVEKLKLSLAIA